MANKIRTGQCVSYGPRFFFLFRFFFASLLLIFFRSSVCTWQVKRVWFWTTAGAVRTPPHRRQPLRFALAVRLLYFFIFFLNFFLLISVLFFCVFISNFLSVGAAPFAASHFSPVRAPFPPDTLSCLRLLLFFFRFFFRFFLAYSFHSFAYTPLLVFLFDFIGQSSVSDTPFDWMERGTPPQKRIKNQFKKNNRKKVTGGWPELRKRSFAEYFDFENKSGIVLFGPGKTSLDVGGTNRLTSLQKKIRMISDDSIRYPTSSSETESAILFPLMGRS